MHVKYVEDPTSSRWWGVEVRRMEVPAQVLASLLDHGPRAADVHSLSQETCSLDKNFPKWLFQTCVCDNALCEATVELKIWRELEYPLDQRWALSRSRLTGEPPIHFGVAAKRLAVGKYIAKYWLTRLVDSEQTKSPTEYNNEN
ncbi:hypothetical protein TNCV_1905831 [Trichonephila clavipes]|nr:hypothetical protein TNCV_1905831 [Trichonephila clavipes]